MDYLNKSLNIKFQKVNSMKEKISKSIHSQWESAIIFTILLNSKMLKLFKNGLKKKKFQ